MKSSNQLVSTEQGLRSSSVYVGFLILQELKKKDRVLILDLYQSLKNKTSNFSYSGALYGLIFLHMNGLVDFDEPYVYRTNP